MGHKWVRGSGAHVYDFHPSVVAPDTRVLLVRRFYDYLPIETDKKIWLSIVHRINVFGYPEMNKRAVIFVLLTFFGG